MKYKNFLYLSQRCKKEVNKKRPCKFNCSVFDVFSVPFSDGFSHLEKHYKYKIRLCGFYKGAQQRKQLDYYRRCLMLLDFYKKV